MPARLRQVSGFLSAFRGIFMPLGLLALVAVGVHAAADVLDDRVLLGVDWLDARLDALLAGWDATAAWVDRVGSRERTLLARGVALAWELAVDGFLALPALGYFEAGGAERHSCRGGGSWRALLGRLNRRPTPMRLLRPVFTAIFVVGGAYAVSRLVESTLFVGLVPDVAPPAVAQVIARVLGAAAMAVVLASHGWRAVLRALQHADAASEAAPTPAGRLLAGTWGTLLAAPLAVALALEARSLLSVVL
jgi:hypothetical protein